MRRLVGKKSLLFLTGKMAVVRSGVAMIDGMPFEVTDDIPLTIEIAFGAGAAVGYGEMPAEGQFPQCYRGAVQPFSCRLLRYPVSLMGEAQKIFHCRDKCH